MDIHVTLRDKRTGVEGVYVDDAHGLLDRAIRSLWVEGSYACDCNRSVFLLGQENELLCSNVYGAQLIELLKIADETGRLIWQPGVLE